MEFIDRKTNFLNFLKMVPDDHLIGVYYVDLNLNIPHYSIYAKNEIEGLLEKVAGMNKNLENDLIRVEFWKLGETRDYMIDIFDGMNEMGD